MSKVVAFTGNEETLSDIFKTKNVPIPITKIREAFGEVDYYSRFSEIYDYLESKGAIQVYENETTAGARIFPIICGLALTSYFEEHVNLSSIDVAFVKEDPEFETTTVTFR